MALTAKQRFELKKFVKELDKYRGRHTELVTVYIPQGYDLNKVINHIKQEQGTAANIKSSATRKNVTDALERMVQHLRLFKETPPHGLAAFSGNVAEREGQSDVKVWSIEPPVPLKTRIYRCDKTFQLDLLRDMLDVKEMYGMVVMDRRDATIAFLKGKTLIPLVSTHSEVPGKTRAGGQSSQRFERLREGAKKDHFKKVADYMKDQFLGQKELKGIMIGGPSVTTNEFVNGDYITTELKKKVIAVKDLSYTGDFGLQELLEKCSDVLSAEEVTAEKEIVQKFLNLLAKNPGMVTYGEAEVAKAIEMGAADIILLSETLDEEKISEFEKKAQTTNVDVRIISTETREGVQLKDLGKIAAILRYEINF
ncbi:peptide chain release factor aRF-1 [Candidatus Woesearchaeota archaeon]|nr:peptide chain release factor aRF-1 [Candidatus Woesearchaeota archaeon]